MNQTTILDELEQEGYVVIPIRGVSMRPLLREESAHVLIRRLEGRPKRNDVLLYVRPDGTQVLHRLMGYDGDVCLIRGDNTFALERVPLSAVKGVMETVWRGSKAAREVRGIQMTDLAYRLYVWFWNLIYPLRWLKHRAKEGVKHIGRLLLGDTTLAWVVKAARGSLGGIVLLTLCTAAAAFLSVMLALVMRNAIDSAVALDRGLFLRWSGVFLGMILAQLILRAIVRQQDESIRASIENKLKERTYEAILNSSYSSLKAYHTGELQNRMTNDTKVVADYATDLIPDVCAMAVQLICAMAVLMVLDWRFASIFLVGGVMMLGVTFLFRRRMKLLHKEVQEADGRLRSWLQESVESLLILKSFEAEEMAVGRTEEKAAAHKKARMKRKTFSNVCNIGFGAVMQGSYLFGLVWCGFGILNGTLTYGTLTAVLELISQIRSPFANISGFVPQYYAMLASAERLIELEKLPKDDKTAGVLPMKDKGAEPLSGNRMKTGTARKMGRASTDLSVFTGLHARNLTFIYDDGEEEVIHDASFDIEKGEIVALTGISGIGKSTLLKILLGIYAPVSGQLYASIMTPAENGVSSAEDQTMAAGNQKADGTDQAASAGSARIALNASARRLFSYVPQGNMLMSGSIYEAVDFVHAAPFTKEQRAKVERACEIACADAFIRELPDGYHTVLGEKGAGLSEGQIQRIAIARALYRDAPVLLLDEATSALDEDTERRLLTNLKNLGDKTVLIVTHRSAALDICGKRLVFENAHITEESINQDTNGLCETGSSCAGADKTGCGKADRLEITTESGGVR
ncbi:MAG: ATP-binding cassette domain-containing protein [Lachnospiraceae bacterium]|nr:ATP-binding cassette domain-containing protein [Lachnospiraceae bacterium]